MCFVGFAYLVGFELEDLNWQSVRGAAGPSYSHKKNAARETLAAYHDAET